MRRSTLVTRPDPPEGTRPTAARVVTGGNASVKATLGSSNFEQGGSDGESVD
jgi:hypothetical protein